MLQIHNDRHIGLSSGGLRVALAHDEAEVAEAQRLRYKVFAEEMGANLPSNNGLDIDHYDAFCQHLIVRDEHSGRVVGTYRLLTPAGAQAAGGWYSAAEFDLSRLTHILPNTVELGRACVHQDYRSGGTITLLWAGLARFMQAYQLDYMMGCGSVSMADGGHFAASLYRQLSEKALSPADYRVFPLCPLPIAALQQDLAVSCPALIKGYIRVGAYICGEPAWDADFNTADMLILLPMSRLNPRYAQHFLKVA